MKISDVMTQEVLSVTPEATIAEAIRMMAHHDISGLPVITQDGALVGVVTEGDLLRRVELGTEKPQLGWAQLLFGGGSQRAAEYVHTHGKVVADVMSGNVATVADDAPLSDAVTTMETHQIKRLPVVRDGRVVGIISRANLIQALGMCLEGAPPVTATDKNIRRALAKAVHELPWSSRRPYTVVRDGVVNLFWNQKTEEWERKALRVVAENVPGVKEVRDHLKHRA